MLTSEFYKQGGRRWQVCSTHFAFPSEVNPAFKGSAMHGEAHARPASLLTHTCSYQTPLSPTLSKQCISSQRVFLKGPCDWSSLRILTESAFLWLWPLLGPCTCARQERKGCLGNSNLMAWPWALAHLDLHTWLPLLRVILEKSPPRWHFGLSASPRGTGD